MGRRVDNGRRRRRISGADAPAPRSAAPDSAAPQIADDPSTKAQRILATFQREALAWEISAEKKLVLQEHLQECAAAIDQMFFDKEELVEQNDAITEAQ